MITEEEDVEEEKEREEDSRRRKMTARSSWKVAEKEEESKEKEKGRGKEEEGEQEGLSYNEAITHHAIHSMYHKMDSVRKQLDATPINHIERCIHLVTLLKECSLTIKALQSLT